MFFAKKLLFFQNFYPKTFTTPGAFSVLLVPGTYTIYMRGGGGAGGEDGGDNDNGTPSSGGAGGKGLLTSQNITISVATIVTGSVGSGGLTFSNGGNGGAGGTYTAIGAASGGGAGGGGGQPSYVNVNGTYYFAQGGGGGGGAGGNGVHHQARFETGSGGGGGGGYYRARNTKWQTNAAKQVYFIQNGNTFFLTLTPEASDHQNSNITIPSGSVIQKGSTFQVQHADGPIFTLTVKSMTSTSMTLHGSHNQNQPNNQNTYDYGDLLIENVLTTTSAPFTIDNVAGEAGSDASGYWADGVDGTVGNTIEFPSLMSGDSGAGGAWDSGDYQNGASGAAGGGAGGASGGGGPQNTDYARGGGGGGGAGGSDDAGGGAAGISYGGADSPNSGQPASNAHTTPTSTTSENATVGITGNYGTGGTTDTNGTGGFVVIKKLS